MADCALAGQAQHMEHTDGEVVEQEEKYWAEDAQLYESDFDENAEEEEWAAD